VDFSPELFFIPFGLLALGLLVLWIWALVDALQVPEDSMSRTGNKLVWVLVSRSWGSSGGAVIYLAIGRPAGGTAPHSGPPPPHQG